MRLLLAWILCLSTVAGVADETPALEKNWESYNRIFRSPRDVLFEIRTELHDRDSALRLQKAAEMLRSISDVEEAFTVMPSHSLEKDQMTVFQLLNSSPVEFGAWLEKLQPKRAREMFRKFARSPRRQATPSDPCATQDPLALKSFINMPGSMPFSKLPYSEGLYVRLKADPEADRHTWMWRRKASRMQDEIRRFYAAEGWPADVVVSQVVAPSDSAKPLFFLGTLGCVLFLALVSFSRREEAAAPAGLQTCFDFFVRRRKAIACLLMALLAAALTLEKIGNRNPDLLHRSRSESGTWSLLPDHSWTPETTCILSEAPGWGEIAYDLGAQEFAFLRAREDRLVTRYWNPRAWIPRGVWQRSNAADFLKKRNAVVLERIARQEGLTPHEFSGTVEFLNLMGEASLRLTHDESALWTLDREQNTLGLRFRNWMRTAPDSIAVLSYCFASPTLSEPALASWISEAVRPFGVEARWLLPRVLEQEALRRALAQMAAVALVGMAAYAGLAGRRMLALRALGSAFFVVSSWLLSLLALEWDWSAGGLWVWTAVVAWHASLSSEWFVRREDSRHDSGLFVATLIAGVTMLASCWIWSWSEKSQGYAAVAATGYFWSTMWCLLLAPSGARQSKFHIQDSKPS